MQPVEKFQIAKIFSRTKILFNLKSCILLQCKPFLYVLTKCLVRLLYIKVHSVIRTVKIVQKNFAAVVKNLCKNIPLSKPNKFEGCSDDARIACVTLILLQITAINSVAEGGTASGLWCQGMGCRIARVVQKGRSHKGIRPKLQF